ncbi:CBS domain-containing protein [Microtetraspora sp. NBRC 13810]|uniref:CBS domain-containing protein n=1 Tax=Microtetraspora sp. NBRC 13810 TaxID=3030990 RepID=UPI002556CF35|nr:CBS domain-containing protein [Microtetraspora sp. NBRC 13810]
MATKVADVMTRDPATVEMGQPISAAAQIMAGNDTGAVIVTDNGQVSGILTDRDIAVRVVAQGRGPDTPVQEACSCDVTTVRPDTSLDEVVRIMRSQTVRRLPVVDNGRPVGVVSLGDMAVERDPESALADISRAEGNL